MRDPKVLALRCKVEVERDDAFSTIAAAVEITTADAMVRKLSQPAARGSDVNQIDDADLEAKLRTAASRRARCAVPAVIQFFKQRHSLDTISRSRGLMRPRFARDFLTLSSEGAGNAGRSMRPQPRMQNKMSIRA